MMDGDSLSVPNGLPAVSGNYGSTSSHSSLDAISSYKASSSSLPRVSSSLKPRTDGRKKFTTQQTLEMEAMFRQTTHPSRDQRLELAQSFAVYVLFLTITPISRRRPQPTSTTSIYYLLLLACYYEHCIDFIEPTQMFPPSTSVLQPTLLLALSLTRKTCSWGVK